MTDKLTTLIYVSRPFGFDDLALSGILASARANNTRDKITGSLICREDLYLQLLEGGEQVVLDAFSRIAKDDRHTDITRLWTGEVETRLFPEWAMRHDPARSWVWSPEEVSRGAAVSASISEVRGIFERLAREPSAP